MPNRLARLDKSAADIVAAHQRHLEGEPGFLRETQGGGVARIGYGHNQIRLGRTLTCERPPMRLPYLVNIAAEMKAVGSREIDVFENAALGRRWRERAERSDAVVV